MTREKVQEEILNLGNSNILLELPTSFGKTMLALTKMANTIKHLNTPKIIIFVPRLLLIDNWKDEFNKWKLGHLLKFVTFSTYNSIGKHIGNWDYAIFDESHHISERCRIILTSYSISNSILLSATIKKEQLKMFKVLFKNLYIYKVSMKTAIDEDILPDPKVYLLPLTLKTGIPTCSIYKNPKGKGLITTSWATRWDVLKQKEFKVCIYCTEQQYLEDLNSQISWFKRKYTITNNDIFKNKWLRLCADRLKWLSYLKNNVIADILKIVSHERTLTFCNSIEQTEELGDNCINSKNKKSNSILKEFNDRKIDHITACNMLNEGMNLVGCRIGIYANLNNSDSIIKQRLGRILRHKSPIIIIPYYKNTREEELVTKMMEDYNPKLVTTINNINDIKI